MDKCNVKFLGQKSIDIAVDKNKICKFYSLESRQNNKDILNHHILLIDISESMKDEILKLSKSVKETLRALKKEKNNFVSVILYAGNENLIVLGEGIRCDDSSYRMSRIYKKIDAELYTREGSSLFNALVKSDEIINDLNSQTTRHNIIIFTDGYFSNVDSSQSQEKESCLEMVERLKELNVCINTVGFGAYYDRDFLKDLAAKSYGGRLSHIEEIKDYSRVVLSEVRRINNSEEVNIEIDNKEYFLLNSNEKIEGKHTINSIQTNKENIIVVFDEDLNIEGEVIERNKKVLKRQYVEDFSYSLARYYVYQDDIDNMEVAVAISNDIYAYESLVNCYSFSEKGKVLEFLDLLSNDRTKRFKKGKKTIKLENEETEALCLLEILKEIMDDKESKLLWDYSYNYKRIGVREKQIEDDYKFIRPKTGYGDVTSITVGSKKLNIGVKVKINGVVQNIKNKLMMNACIYRDYNLVVNGNINTDEIWCKLSKGLKSKIKSQKIIKDIIKIYDEEICVLNLKNVRLTNKRTSKLINESTLAKYLYDVRVLDCEIWALENLIKEVFSEVELEEDGNLNREELDMRNLFRVDEKGVYSPIKVERDIESKYEFYLSKVVEWKIERFPRTNERKKALEKYKSFIIGDVKSSYKRILDKLKELEAERYDKQSLINIVRLSNKLRERNYFIWDEVITKRKVETDKELKKNVVIDETVNISRKDIDGIKIREDYYEVLSKYN